MHRLVSFSVVSAALACCFGCSDGTVDLQTQLQATQAKVADLEQQREGLIKQVAESKKIVEASAAAQKKDQETLRAELRQLQASWQEFENAHSPEIAAQLKSNVAGARQAEAEANDALQAAEEALASLKKLTTEAEKLKTLCAQHAAEAKDANLVGALKQSQEALNTTVASLKSKVSRVEQDARKAISDARSAASKASRAESSARRALSRAR